MKGPPEFWQAVPGGQTEWVMSLRDCSPATSNRPYQLPRTALTAMTEAIASTGFVIERLVEPAPAPELASLDPEAHKWLRTEPRFLFFRLLPSRRTTGCRPP